MSYAEIEYKVRDTSWAMSELQSHPYYELYLLTDGSRELFCENKMFNVSAGMLSVIAPFAMHKTTGGSYKRINVYVSPDLLTERERALLERLSEGVALALGTEAYRHISELLTYGSDIRIVDHNEKTALKLAFIKAMMYILETDAPTSIASDASVPSETKDGHMLRIVSYVNEHYQRQCF